MEIPSHLARLPLDAEGLPVTFTTKWSSETRPYVRPEPLLDNRPAIFVSGEPGDGNPQPAMASPDRTRRSVLLGLCQVCGEPTADRYLADLRAGAAEFRFDSRIVPLVIDSWTCARCLPFSIVTCPGLRRKRPDFFVVRDWLPVPTPERPRWIRVGDLPYGPIGFVKIAVVDAERIPWPDLGTTLSGAARGTRQEPGRAPSGALASPRPAGLGHGASPVRRTGEHPSGR